MTFSYLLLQTNLCVAFQVDNGIPLQSAAKVPIVITLNVEDGDGNHNDVKPQGCIFKALREGIIEVVRNSRSKSQMGETTAGGLYEIFLQDNGPAGSPSFEVARDSFNISSAGYAVASLLLQPKDRHNGNLLFDNVGRLVHIDFEFILETSPGENMHFEGAHFKLTQLLDPSGVMKSDTWIQFNVVVEQVLEPGLRVTVAMGTDRHLDSDLLLTVVPSSKPREELGQYWGYKVRSASNISDVFSGCPYEGGYDHKIGTSEHGSIFNSTELRIPTFRHLLIAFGGLSGLEESIEEDCQLKGAWAPTKWTTSMRLKASIEVEGGTWN